MDTFRAVAGRLIAVALLVFMAGCFAPRIAVAQTGGSYATEYSNCEYSASTYQAEQPQAGPYDCTYEKVGSSCGYELTNGDGVVVGGFWGDCVSGVSPGACSNLTSTNMWLSGQILDSYYTDQTTTDPVTGNTVNCRVQMVPLTPPMKSRDGWFTYVGMNPDSTTADSNPVPAGSVVNGSGQTPSPSVPSVPSAASGDAPAVPPTMCGGGSCYDPSTGNACATGSSGQVCIQVQNATGATAGGCASGGSTTVCGGTPSAPSPVGQPNSTITNPPTQIQGSDTYTSANPSTGAVVGTTVNVYSSGGATSSGASSSSISTSKGSSSTVSGNSGPASSSSAGGNGDSYGGGTDCNTPPVCQGDAVECGIAQETWQTSCNVTTQTTAMVGSNPSQQPPTYQSDLTKYSQSQVWTSNSATSGTTTGDDANQGQYDQSGFGFGTRCPLTDFQMSSIPFTVHLSAGCNVLEWAGAIILGFALYRAACITAGSNE